MSHDREFLNNVVTSTIVFEEGGVQEYVGGYDDWLRQRPTEELGSAASGVRNEAVKSQQNMEREPVKKKLAFKEKQEFEQLPKRIEETEAAIAKVHANMATAGFYQRSGEEIAEETNRLKELEAKLEAAYARWEELMERA